MSIKFIKQKSRAYIVVVGRSDLVRLQFCGVGKKFLIPHDLTHLIVESRLSMRHGFWGCVDDGALFSGMSIVKGRQKAHAKSKSQQVIKKAHQQLRQAECLVRVFDEIVTAKLNLIEARRHCSQISAEIEPELSNSAILDICSTLETFQSRWQALDIEESIKLSWNRESPSKSLGL